MRKYIIICFYNWTKYAILTKKSNIRKTIMKYTYYPRGTCSRQILFDVTEDDILTNVKFIGGCSGNLQAIARLVDGKDIDEVIKTLKGIRCKGNTSCGDQLATALMEYKEKKAQPDKPLKSN